MDSSVISISNSISKEFSGEALSLSRASLEDAESRLADGVKKPEAISNERIRKGDEILQTYQVTSGAIHGGMGSVWCVHHKIWDVDLAMKRPQPRFFAEGSERRKEEFIEECQHWIDLGLHPNIVSCYYVREIGGVPTIFSEWMDGGSLKDRIQDGSLYEGTDAEIQARILDIAIQTSRGLRYSHENGLVHQDVKPGNILLTEEWDAKIADFGLAKAQKRLEDEGTEGAGGAEGPSQAAGDGNLSTGYTPAYCPAEQAAGAPAEAWMDYYAWAVTVLEMYAGSRQWTSGAEVPLNIDKYCAESRIPVPEEVKQLLRECLQDRSSSQKIPLPSQDETLQRIYREVSGHAYARTDTGTLDSAADNLNNYALSMLDLGHEKAALAAWDKAVQTYPEHLESAVNRAFFLWRSAVLSDNDVLEILNVFPESEEKSNILGIFALERGEKQLSEDGITETDIKLPVNRFVNNAVYESDERVWLATRGSLSCYDTSSGSLVEEIREEQAGTGLSLLALASGNKVIYAGSTGHIVRIDRGRGNQIETVEIAGGPGKDIQYPDETVNENGKRRGRYGKDTEWCNIWLEENETVLCLIEKSKWADEAKLREFRDWCNYPMRRKTPRPPQVPNSDLYHVLRYRLQTPVKAGFVSVTRLDGKETAKLNSASAAHCTKWESAVWQKDKQVPVSRLRDAATGRFVRSHKGYSASIIAFSPDQKHYLLRLGLNDISSRKEAYLCTVPEIISGNLLYTLSRVKDIKTVQAEDEKAKTLYESFCSALEASNYPEAIRCFEEYRDIPGRQDSQTLLEMETGLSKVCRRTKLHHYGNPPADLAGFELTIFEPVEFRGLHYSYGTRVWDAFIRDDLYHPLYSSAQSAADSIDRTADMINKALPIKYTDDSGVTKKIDGGFINVELVDLIKKHNYAWVDEKEPDPRTGRYSIGRMLLDVDMQTGKTAVMAKDSSSDGYPLFAPDGKKWLLIRTKGSGSIKCFDKDKTGSFISAPQGAARFSPDSEFILLKQNRTNVFSIAGLTPEGEEKEQDGTQIVELPALPEKKQRHAVYFSADGLLLLLLDREQKKHEPWLRLFWDYEPRVEAEPLKQTAAEQKVPEVPKTEKPKSKGLFSRLFGKG